MARRILLFVILAVLVLAGSACGGGGNKRATTVAVPSPTSEVPQTQENPDGQGKDVKYSDAELSGALLQLTDMPTGWTTASSDEDGDDSTEPCAQDFSDSFYTEVESGFQQSETGPFVFHSIQAYFEDEAENAMSSAQELLDSCTEWEETNDDGSRVTWRVQPLSFPELGDETIAIRLSTDNIPFYGSFGGDLAFVRIDDLISAVVFFNLGLERTDAEEEERLARLAVDRLGALVD